VNVLASKFAVCKNPTLAKGKSRNIAMIRLLLWSALFDSVTAASTPSDVEKEFEEFQSAWGKNYGEDEHQKRLRIFADNLETIKELQRVEQGTAIYSHLAIFTDQSPEEMSQRKGYSPLAGLDAMENAPLLNETLLDSIDWVTRGAVNPIKNQGRCGSCWSFSTVANVEGAGKVTTGKLVSLSEQNILDCDKRDGSCNGGRPDWALQWMSKGNGIASEHDYPYQARDERCRSGVRAIAHVRGFQKIDTNENQIAQALAKYGPLAISLDASGLQSYQGGIISNPRCSSSPRTNNHAVNIVGYGTGRNLGYWKIRNSWGTSYGEGGYVRIVRGKCGCGLCTEVVTATGVTIGHSPPAPGPSPGPSPRPSPCKKCKWNSECPSAQKCYYHSASATSGCCRTHPPSTELLV
jgi:C1A family cysteine protease